MPKPANPTTIEAARINEAIEALGVGGKARVAEALELTPGAVSQFASGHRPVPWGRAEALAREIGLTAYEISAEYRRIADHFSASQLARLTPEIILAAYREAAIKYEAATGLQRTSFQPMSDAGDAELLVLALVAHLTAEPSGSIEVEAEVGRGARRKDRKGSRVAGENRQAEAGEESGPEVGQRKKRAAGGSRRA